MKLHRSAMADDERKAAAEVAHVRVARATKAEVSAGLALPGSVDPLQETSVYARANGYVRRWLVDIGGKVKKDQVLAELDLPDIDEELGQARASAAQANAGIAQATSQVELARATDQRYQALRPSGVVSQQEVDQTHASNDAQQANLAAAEAAYGSAQANVRRAMDLKGFGTLVAPFDGVVTMRSAEIGQLVTSGMAGQPLFKVADVAVVRVFVRVPQLYAAGIHIGMDAPATVREMPGRVFHGTVARTANELDPSTRTLRTEVDLPNADYVLFAGMYAQVRFDVKRQDEPIFVPSTARSLRFVRDAGGGRSRRRHSLDEGRDRCRPRRSLGDRDGSRGGRSRHCHAEREARRRPSRAIGGDQVGLSLRLEASPVRPLLPVAVPLAAHQADGMGQHGRKDLVDAQGNPLDFQGAPPGCGLDAPRPPRAKAPSEARSRPTRAAETLRRSRRVASRAARRSPRTSGRAGRCRCRRS